MAGSLSCAWQASLSTPLVDEYPTEGHVTTSAMAEGAIEGRASMYEVASAHATAFVFSRFDSEG